MKTSSKQSWNERTSRGAGRWIVTGLLGGLSGLVGGGVWAQEPSTQTVPFSVKGWGTLNTQWGGGQELDPRATRLIGTSDDSPEDDTSLAVGDLNGDGCTDVAIGLPSSAGGVVQVYYGTQQGDWDSAKSDCEPPSPPFLTLTSHDAGFGSQLLVAELSGDTAAELVVSAPQANRGRPGQTFPLGTVAIFPGRSHGLSDQPIITLEAGETDERLGYGLTLSPDMTGDGVQDVWVASGHDSLTGQGEGRVLLWPGNACWSEHPPPDCPKFPPAQEIADELVSTSPFFELLAPDGADLEFGSATLRLDDMLLTSDPNCNAGGNCVAYAYPALSGSEGSLGTALIGHDSASSQLARIMLNIQSESGFYVLASAHRWRDLNADISKVGRLERYQLLSNGSWARVSWERPAWDLVNVSEDYKGDGLSTGLSLLEPLDYAGPVTDRSQDSLPELVTSNPGYCRSGGLEAQGLHPGRIYLIETDTLWADADFSTGPARPLPVPFAWEGESNEDCFGQGVAGGDFNGDGLYDLVVRASDGNDAGSSESPGTLTFIWSVSLLMDPDGDGYSSYPGLAPKGSDAQWSTFQDGLGRSLNGLDCDETDPNVHADAAEVCNDLDDDCDGTVDESLKILCFQDKDRDGYGVDQNDANLWACTCPDGYSTVNEDCDDDDDTIHPGVEELCNGMDDDCDGKKLGDDGELLSELDRDGDDYLACDSVSPDCDDNDNLIYPGAVEHPGEKGDEDCDGMELCYVDADGDDYRSEDGKTIVSSDGDCKADHEATAAQQPDCDDNDDSIHPNAAELYNTDYSESCDDDHFNACRAPPTLQLESAPGCLVWNTTSRSAVAPLTMLSLAYLRTSAKRRRGSEHVGAEMQVLKTRH